MSFPFANKYVYLIKSKDGKIDYVADLEKDSNNLDTDEVLRNILTYAQDNAEFPPFPMRPYVINHNGTEDMKGQ